MTEPLKWTKEKPTTFGTYWYRSKFSGIQSVQVFDRAGLCAHFIHYGAIAMRDVKSDGEWYGPIQPPE